MIKSMTGFGRAAAEQGNLRLAVELSCVNRKQFDCTVALPREWLALEPVVQALARQRCARGYLKVNVAVAYSDDAGMCQSLREQVALLRRLAKELDLADDLKASSLLQCPDFLRGNALPEPDEAIKEIVLRVVSEALEGLDSMRRREGSLLEVDLRERFGELGRLREEVLRRAAGVPERYREVLKGRLEGLLSEGAALDAGTLEREVAIFADRCDVSEELTRLGAHLEHAGRLLDGGEPCGRALDFLCQELFREINTTGSKANDAEVTSLVIAFKAKLETVREQIQNVE